jgi:class 3 adenylate cyclase/tetratricopeptide (TPR) repeat protein
VCGAGLRDGARFCDACGSPVAAADSRAEYKQVTVLFADVVHSMDIAAAVGAERLREIMGEVFRRSSVIVQRYGGTVDKFTGDGIMAVFGAPVALEDHAVRACRAALDIQTDAKHLAAEVDPRDHISLQLRIGLNSGEVITGEIGSGPMTYTAIGEQVGMAQRMESVAPPGGVMVSDSTARLVDTVAMLGETEQVHIKGAEDPVPAHRLLGMATGPRPDRAEPTFVGRQWEMGALRGVFERALNGNGSVVGVVGPPGIGKSRIVREVTSRADDADVEVSVTYCESHTTDLPFHAAAGLLRSTTGLDGLAESAAREQVRASFPDAYVEDLLLLDDLLGIADPADSLPQIDPDARRRRIAAMVKTAALARTTPIVYVIEDAHWIDGISESMLAEFLTVIPQTPSLVLITYRPEYSGALAHAPRSQTITLEPLDEAQMLELGAELLGEDRSVVELSELIVERAAGNPFFAEEIVRDLSERDVLVGGRGCYLCADPVGEVHVPRTLQAVIAARIDRLDPAAKRALNAAAVIGSRFTPAMLTVLGVQSNLADLVAAELIDQTASQPSPEYAFRHPLVRAVAYESQLKSDRAQLHRRVADAIEKDDQSAALIAEHLEAAGDLPGAYEWHMRAGGWLTNRDIAAAQLCWQRAMRAADASPPDTPNRLAKRIAPRTLLCGSSWRTFHPDISAQFAELRDLCTEADDKASLAMGMAGLTVEHVLHNRLLEASRLASEYMAIVESLAEPALTVALSFAAIVAKHHTGQSDDVMRWAQDVIDFAGPDLAVNTSLIGSPSATAYTWRGVGRFQKGLPGWREDFDRASAIAEQADSLSRSAIITYKYAGIPRGVFLADDSVLGEIETALQLAERSNDDMALVLLPMTFGMALVHNGGDRQRGYDILRALRETCVKESFALNIVAFIDAYLARELAENGQIDEAIRRWRKLTDEMLECGNFANIDVPQMFLVEALTAQGRYDEAILEIDRLATTTAKREWRSREMSVLRLRTLLAQARGDETGYRELRDEYRAMAEELEFEGHMKWAAELP